MLPNTNSLISPTRAPGPPPSSPLSRRLRRAVNIRIRQSTGWMRRVTGAIPSAESLRDSTPVESSRISCTGTLDQFGDFLFSTKSGVYSFIGGEVRRLLGHPGYGLTFADGRWYAFQRIDQLNVGMLVSFVFDGAQARDIRHETRYVSTEVHQIDAWKGCLYIADTLNNRLIRRQLQPAAAYGNRIVYPNGRALRGKQSANYAHINSVYCDNDFVWLVYHNYSKVTGKPSQIVKLDHALNIVEKLDIAAYDAHNIVPYRGNLLYCDSSGKALIYGDRRIDLGGFTRGLAIVNNRIFVGRSEWTTVRENRGDSTATIFLIDADTAAVAASLQLQEIGGLYEIRPIGVRDEARSDPSQIPMVSMSRNESQDTRQGGQ
jgi:hypothetical protein